MVHAIDISHKIIDINILSAKSLVCLVTIVLIFCYKSPVTVTFHTLLLRCDSLVKTVAIVLYFSLRQLCIVTRISQLSKVRQPCINGYDNPVKFITKSLYLRTCFSKMAHIKSPVTITL
jgi:hypothetical protein